MSIYRELTILVLRVALVLILVGAGWLVYKRLPASTTDAENYGAVTTLQIVMKQPTETVGSALDVIVELYPVDIVAVGHEFFTEPRVGKRFEDFLKERMKGRSPVSAHLDKQGRGFVLLAPGNWWLHATLAGDEEFEWRLPVSVVGARQTLELTTQNAYTHSKTF
jgi:hypothetical protein